MRKQLPKLFLLFALLSLSGLSYAQVPTPLDSADFPHPFDSVFVRASKIPPTESFTDSISANDSLTIDRCLQKAIDALNDTYMTNIAAGGAGLDWDVVTFYYTALPNPNNWTKKWMAPNPFVPGSTSFPAANLYYQSIVAGLTTYNYFQKTAGGLYELGSRVMDATPYNVLNNPAKPTILFPVDYNAPNNVVNLDILTTMQAASTNSHLNITIDAYGTLTLVTGTISSPISTDYANCLRAVTYSIDTMDLGSGMLFFLETKIYSWYAPGFVDPIVIYSASQVRNNIDPMFWSMDPMLAWHDEIEMAYCLPFAGSSIEDGTLSVSTLNIVPNPCDGKFSILLPETMLDQSLRMEVYDVSGRLVLSGQAMQYNGIVNVEMPWDASGVYFVKLLGDDQVFNGKVIVR